MAGGLPTVSYQVTFSYSIHHPLYASDYLESRDYRSILKSTRKDNTMHVTSDVDQRPEQKLRQRNQLRNTGTIKSSPQNPDWNLVRSGARSDEVRIRGEVEPRRQYGWCYGGNRWWWWWGSCSRKDEDENAQSRSTNDFCYLRCRCLVANCVLDHFCPNV